MDNELLERRGQPETCHEAVDDMRLRGTREGTRVAGTEMRENCRLHYEMKMRRVRQLCEFHCQVTFVQ